MLRRVIHPLFAAMLCITLTTPSLANAQEDELEVFQAHVDAGLEAYQNRDYELAISEFESAFAIREEPELVFNIARSHERALQREEAIEQYDRYIELPGTTSETRARAIEARANLQRELEALNAPPERQMAWPPAPTAGEGTGVPVETSSGAPPGRILGAGLTIVGSIVFAGGAGVGIFALTKQNEFDRSTDRDQQITLRDEIDRLALTADILFAVGGLSLITGVILMLANPLPDAPADANDPESEEEDEDEEEQSAVYFEPTISPRMFGLSVRGTF